MSLTSARVVAHRRIEPADSLQFFPTPPWATRALFHHVLGRRGFGPLTVEEPACGEGHMSYVLEEYFGTVRSSDVHPYGFGEVRDFLEPAAWASVSAPHWIITNPPFGALTLRFMLQAIERATLGVAMFVRTTQLEGMSRYRDLFLPRRPTIVAQFAERVPLHKGRWEPEGGTMTAYCWIVWRLDEPAKSTVLDWIPPCRKTLTLAADVARFGSAT